jgi:hypothetical protein
VRSLRHWANRRPQAVFADGVVTRANATRLDVYTSTVACVCLCSANRNLILHVVVTRVAEVLWMGAHYLLAQCPRRPMLNLKFPNNGIDPNVLAVPLPTLALPNEWPGWSLLCVPVGHVRGPGFPPAHTQA